MSRPFLVLRVLLSLVAGIAGASVLAFQQSRVVPAVQASPVLDAAGVSPDRFVAQEQSCTRYARALPWEPNYPRNLWRVLSRRARGDRDTKCVYLQASGRPVRRGQREPGHSIAIFADSRGLARSVTREIANLEPDRARVVADSILALGLALPGTRPMTCRSRGESQDDARRGWYTEDYQATVMSYGEPRTTVQLSVSAGAWAGCPWTSTRRARPAWWRW